MNSWWLRFLVVTGIISCIEVVAPWLLLPAIFFPPLAILLACVPSAFLYASAITIIYYTLHWLEIWRVGISVGLVALFAFGMPFFFNQNLASDVRQLTADDVQVSRVFEGGGTIVLERKQWGGSSRYKTWKCPSLCQQLLYNGAFENVIVRGSSDRLGYRFRIEKRANCPIVKQVLNSVSTRIAAGECLIGSDAPREIEGMYYRDKYEKGSLGILIRRLELFEGMGESFALLHRETKVRFEPFMFPLLYALNIEIGVGGGGVNFEFVRRKKIINNYGRNIKNEAKKIFGDATEMPKGASVSKQALIMRALKDKSAGKVAGHELIDDFLGNLRKKKLPTDEEMQLIIAILKDSRADKLSNLSRATARMDVVPEAYVQALANRLLKIPSGDVARAIASLPAGAAESIYPQLVQIIEHQSLRYKAYAAIPRLNDSGIIALPKYVALLEKYRDALDEQNARIREKNTSLLHDATLSSFKGLCLLGAEAISTQELLFSFVSIENPRHESSRYAVSALLQMGLVNELSTRFEAHEKLWSHISSRITMNAVMKKSGKSECGR